MSVRAKDLDKAVWEAQRFLEAADDLKLSARAVPYGAPDPWYEDEMYCAAVKLASMDLSKALASVRKGVQE